MISIEQNKHPENVTKILLWRGEKGIYTWIVQWQLCSHSNGYCTSKVATFQIVQQTVIVITAKHTTATNRRVEAM